MADLTSQEDDLRTQLASVQQRLVQARAEAKRAEGDAARAREAAEAASAARAEAERHAADEAAALRAQAAAAQQRLGQQADDARAREAALNAQLTALSVRYHEAPLLARSPGDPRRVAAPPPPSLPYKVDTSRPSLRTNWTRLEQARAAQPGDPRRVAAAETSEYGTPVSQLAPGAGASGLFSPASPALLAPGDYPRLPPPPFPPLSQSQRRRDAQI